MVVVANAKETLGENKKAAKGDGSGQAELKAGDDRKKSISGPTNKRQTYSEEKLIALAEAFALSDICTGRSGKIPATEVSTAMRRLGQCPTQLEVNKAIIDVEILRKSKVAAARDEANSKTKKKKKRTGRGECGEDDDEEEDLESLNYKIMFPDFLTVLEKNEKKPETARSIIAAFREFDRKGRGVISTKKLMKIMTGMGEKLSQTEVDEMVRQTECYNGDGKVKYEKFVKMMMED